MAFETGAISFSALQSYFGGSNPVALSEYYRGGANVPATTTTTTTYNSGTLGSNFGSGRAQDQHGMFRFTAPSANGGGQVWAVVGSDAGTRFNNLPSVGTVGTSVSVTGGSTTGSTVARVYRDSSANNRRFVIINNLNNATSVSSFSMTSGGVTWTFSYIGTDYGRITSPSTIKPDGYNCRIGTGSGAVANPITRSFSYARSSSTTVDANTGIPSSGELSAEDFRGADAP